MGTNQALSMVQPGENMKTQVAEMTRSQYAIRALDWPFERPIFSSSHFRDGAGDEPGRW